MSATRVRASRAPATAMLVGAAVALAILLYRGRHNSSWLLLAGMSVWVLSPHALLAIGSVASRRWSDSARATLRALMVVVPLGSLLIYVVDTVRQFASTNAFVFVALPPVSWLLIVVVLAVATLAGRRTSGATTQSSALGTGAALVVLGGVLGLFAVVVALAIERRTELTLPAPTGPFPVGRTIADWTDTSTVDTFAPVAGTTRELLVWFWYPAEGTAPAVGDYVPAELRRVSPPASSGLFALMTRDASRVHSHTISNAAVSPRDRVYPVVIMRTGASGGTLGYSTLAEDLASHGYVVVGFDAPYRTSLVVFPDGRVMTGTPANDPETLAGERQMQRLDELLAGWTADIAFVVGRLDQLNRSDPSGRFTGRLDVSRLGVFGHSFGGAQAAEFCHEDSRCRAGVDIDGLLLGPVVRAGLHQPFMFILSDHSGETDPASLQIRADIQSVYDRLPPDRRARVSIRGANHFLFSDDGAFFKSRIVLRGLRAVGVVGIDGPRQLAVTAYCLRSFFDVHLKGKAELTLASAAYPEVEVK